MYDIYIYDDLRNEAWSEKCSSSGYGSRRMLEYKGSIHIVVILSITIGIQSFLFEKIRALFLSKNHTAHRKACYDFDFQCCSLWPYCFNISGLDADWPCTICRKHKHSPNLRVNTYKFLHSKNVLVIWTGELESVCVGKCIAFFLYTCCRTQSLSLK